MRLRVAVALVAATVVMACSSATPAPESPHPEGTLLRPGETLERALTDADPTWGTHGRFHRFRFNAAANQRFVIEMGSADFDTYLVVGRMSGGVFDPMNEDDDSGGDLDSRIRFTAPAAGTYYVLAQAYAEYGLGSYTISLTELAPPRPAVAVAIPVGAMEEGRLAEDDPLDEYEEKNYDLYTFEATAGHRYAIVMESDWFDTYLVLGRDMDGFEEITRNDDGGVDTNSRIVFTADESGTYAIRATSFGGEYGDYVVRVDELAAPGPLEVARISLGDQVDGWLEETDQIADDGSYYDVYRFHGREGQRVSITMSSGDLDSYLELGESADEFWSDYSDDDSGGGVDARIVATLWRTGEFEIRASSFYADAAGGYTLTLEEAPEPGPAEVRSIRIGETVTGSLEPDDALLEDNTYYDVYTFDAPAGTRVSITLRSDDFDAYLIFGPWIDGMVEFTDSDDDSGGGFTGLDSQLQLTLPTSGMYGIQVNTVGSYEIGDYELTLEEQ